MLTKLAIFLVSFRQECARALVRSRNSHDRTCCFLWSELQARTRRGRDGRHGKESRWRGKKSGWRRRSNVPNNICKGGEEEMVVDANGRELFQTTSVMSATSVGGGQGERKAPSWMVWWCLTHYSLQGADVFIKLKSGHGRRRDICKHWASVSVAGSAHRDQQAFHQIPPSLIWEKKKLIEAEPVGKHHLSQCGDFPALPFAPSITIRATGASVSTQLAWAATRGEDCDVFVM